MVLCRPSIQSRLPRQPFSILPLWSTKDLRRLSLQQYRCWTWPLTSPKLLIHWTPISNFLVDFAFCLNKLDIFHFSQSPRTKGWGLGMDRLPWKWILIPSSSWRAGNKLWTRRDLFQRSSWRAFNVSGGVLCVFVVLQLNQKTCLGPNHVSYLFSFILLE